MSTVSIVMENTLNEIIAYISLKNYPNIYSLDPAVWLDWVQFHYGWVYLKIKEFLFFNCLDYEFYF